MNDFDLLCDRLRSRLSACPTFPVTPALGGEAAAVSLILRRHLDAAELLMIKRAVRTGDHWSGNLALPGGRWQAGDADLLATAVRETREEVGIDLGSGGEVLGHLNTITTRNPLVPRVSVSSFVAAAPARLHVFNRGDETPPLATNHEVAAAFWTDVAGLRSSGRSEVVRLMVGEAEREWPAYPTAHGPVWGLTETILTTFLMLIA